MTYVKIFLFLSILIVFIPPTISKAVIKLITREILISETNLDEISDENVANADKNEALPSIENEEEQKEYEWITPKVPILSPDKKHTGYIASRAGKTFAVIDGVEGKGYYDVGMPLIFSPDSTRVAYAAATGSGNKWVIVVDDSESKEYDAVRQTPMFSPDSKTVVSVVKDAEKEFALINGVEGKKYTAVFGAVFSPDSKQLAYAAWDGTKGCIVFNGVESEKYDSAYMPVFSPDSKRFAYIVKQDGRSFVIVDGAEAKGNYEGIHYVLFSPDSKRAIYVGTRGYLNFLSEVGEIYRIKRGDRMVAIIKDEVESKGYDDIYALVYSYDYSHKALRACRDGKWLVVVDQVEGNEYDEVGNPVFSPDGKRVAYIAKRGVKFFFVVNGSESQECNVLSSTNEPLLAFDGPTKFRGVTNKMVDNVIKTYRIEVEIVGE